MIICEHKISLEVLLQALSSQIRAEILSAIASERCCVNGIAQKLDLPQSVVSQHLRILRLAGIVDATKDGKESFYSLKRDVLEEIINYLSEILESDKRCRCDIEDNKCGCKKYKQKKGGK